MVLIVLLISSSIRLSFAKICEASTSSEYVIRSDVSTEVYDSDMKYIGQSLVIFENSYLSLPGSTWIWNTIPTKDKEILNFIESFNLNSLPLSGTLKVIVDDSVIVYVNNNFVCEEYTYNVPKTCDIKANLKIGLNNVRFKAKNEVHRAGLIYEIILVF